MPIWLRRFTFETLREHYEKQNEEAEKQQNMLSNKGKNDILRKTYKIAKNYSIYPIS